jgi:outer membrane protein with beta-barrel domain
LLCGIALCLVLTAPAAPAWAQRKDRPHRSGLWGEFGAGPGRVRIACSGCTDVVTASGLTSYVRIGGTVSDRVVIGLEVFALLNRGFGFSPGDTITTAETATAAVVVLWFPSRRGFFFKGGAGIASGQFTIPGTAGADTSNSAGIGITFGFGWDVALSRKFAITTNFAAYVTAVGDVILPGQRVDDVIATMYQAGVSLTFR